jgi:hypothetical protein
MTGVRDRGRADGVNAELLSELAPQVVLVHTGNVTISSGATPTLGEDCVLPLGTKDALISA